MAWILFHSVNSAKFIIVQPPTKLNMNKTTLLALAGIAHGARRQWGEWVWWRWNGWRTERTSATFTTSRTIVLQHSGTGTQLITNCLFSEETFYKTHTVSPPPEIMITAGCFYLCSLLTVILSVRGSSGRATDHRDPAQLLWFLMHGPKINSLLIRKAERLVRWALQSRGWEDW